MADGITFKPGMETDESTFSASLLLHNLPTQVHIMTYNRSYYHLDQVMNNLQEGCHDEAEPTVEVAYPYFDKLLRMI